MEEVRMTTRVNVYSYLLVIQILMGLGGSSARAQLDPTKALVGKWEGHVEIPGNSERTLIIESVIPKDGGWVAEGRFGSTGGNLGRRSIEVSQQGGDIILEFVTGAKTPNPVRLKLVGERKLEGTINVVVGGARGTSDRGFKLEKVEPKAGDVK
jgi:hypothetical protein